MIKFIASNDIDKQKWDDCVFNSSNSSIYAYSWYLDVVSENWFGLVLNDYEAVFPLVSKSKIGIHYLYQPFFSRYLGVYSSLPTTKELITSFLLAIPSKYKFLEFNFHYKDSIELPRFTFSIRQFQYLKLNQMYDDLKNLYSENAKRNIKKAIKFELRIEKTISPSEIVNLFKTNKGGELQVFKAKDFRILANLMTTCLERNCAETFAVYDKENKLCAAAFFIKNKNRYTFLKGAVSNDGKSNGVMHLLFDTFINEHSNTNNVLDFGGSSVESVARFYKNFGAENCVYLQVKKNNLPHIVKLISGKF